VPDGRQRSPVDRYTDGVDLLRSEEVEAADWRVELAEPPDRERRCERLFLKVKFSRPTANRRKMSSATVLRLAPLFASFHALSPSPRVSRKASRTLPKSFVRATRQTSALCFPTQQTPAAWRPLTGCRAASVCVHAYVQRYAEGPEDRFRSRLTSGPCSTPCRTTSRTA